MKKKYFYIICIASLILAMASCDDNTGVTGLHGLTQDEIDEIARQDSILEAQKNNIDAKLILEYTVSFDASPTSYDGTTLTIELEKIAELFGISKDQLLLGINGESGAPEIKGYALDVSTRKEQTSSTAGGPWGFWFNKDGDVTSWSADTNGSNVVYAEFSAEDEMFFVGQHPGRLVGGENIKLIMVVRYTKPGEESATKAAVVINCKINGENKITANIVNTQEIEVSVKAGIDYDQTHIQFDLKKTLADLGVSSMSEVEFLGVKDDGDYTIITVADNGFMHNSKGNVDYDYENAHFYTQYGIEGVAEDYVVIEQNPSKIRVGDKLTIKYGFLANDKIEMLNIVVNVIPYKETVIKEKNITMTKVWSDDYGTVEADIKDALIDALKIDEYELCRAIVTGDLRVYLNEESGSDPEYTGETPGYWINPDGNAGSWGKEAVIMLTMKFTSDYERVYLAGMNFPAEIDADITVPVKMIVTYKEEKIILNVTFKVTKP